jgi:hypothetical protein
MTNTTPTTPRGRNHDYSFARLPCSLLHDPRLIRLTAPARWIYVAVYLFCTEKRLRTLPPHLADTGSLSAIARCDQRTVAKALQSCIDTGLAYRTPEGALTLCNIEEYAHKNMVWHDQQDAGNAAQLPSNGEKETRQDQTRQDQTRPDQTGTAPAAPVDDADFLSFWLAYPAVKRSNESATRQAWSACGKDLPPVKTITNSLQWWARQEQWAKDDGRYIPGPAKFITDRLWQAAPPPIPTQEEAAVRRRQRAEEEDRLQRAKEAKVIEQVKQQLREWRDSNHWAWVSRDEKNLGYCLVEAVDFTAPVHLKAALAIVEAEPVEAKPVEVTP